MRWLQWIVDFLFGCGHRRTTWPRRDAHGFGYIRCLSCGKALPYSLRRMSVLTRQEQLAEQSALLCKGPGGACLDPVATDSAKVLIFEKNAAKRGMAASAATGTRVR